MPTTKFRDAQDLVIFFEHRVKYKPGYQLRAWTRRNSLTLQIDIKNLPDANGGRPLNTVFFTQGYRVDRLLGDPAAFMVLLRKFFLRFEQHELDEWLKVDGQPLKKVSHD